MGRTFSASRLVQLPRLDAASAVSLGVALEAAAKDAGKLPAGIGKARRAMSAAHAALRDEHAARLTSGAASTQDQKGADVRIDGAWGATFTWLKGFERLPEGLGGQQAATAAGLLAQLFPDDLKFTQLRYRQEWAESDARLRRIDQQGLDKQFEQLGGAVFLGAIRKTHSDYGRALGITQAAAPEGPAPQLRASLESFNEALRDYVLQVTASVDRDDPTTGDLAARLLSPLDDYETRVAPAQPAPAPEPAPAPGG